MYLYHFTRRKHLEAIERDGLIFGDVANSGIADRGLNGVWLTKDPTPTGNGLAGRPANDDERAFYQQLHGEKMPDDFRFPNRMEIRIKVKLRETDPRLKCWWTWSRQHVVDAVHENLIENGGGKRKARNWFIYFGVIPPEAFERVDDLVTQAETQRAVNDLNQRLR